MLGMNTSITRIAHVSDVHMLERRPSGSRSHYDLRIKLLSFGRRLDALARVRKLTLALDSAKKSGAQHYVISGDLTESGTPAQFEQLAETLHGTGIDPDRMTLVPGNHDAYTTEDAWGRAILGPLRAFAGGSAGEVGKVVDRGDVCLVPLDVSFHQPITRSAGVLTPQAASSLWRRMKDTALRRRAMVVVQHHPPFAHARGPWQWIDGLRGTERQMDLLANYPHVQVLHGHLHHVVDRAPRGGRAHIFGAPAVVEDKEGRPRVRMYELRDGALESAGLALS